MSDFFVPLMVRTIGISMMAVTLTNQAVVGLKPKDIPQGVALNNMMRQLGGAFGIALPSRQSILCRMPECNDGECLVIKPVP